MPILKFIFAFDLCLWVSGHHSTGVLHFKQIIKFWDIKLFPYRTWYETRTIAGTFSATEVVRPTGFARVQRSEGRVTVRSKLISHKKVWYFRNLHTKLNNCLYERKLNDDYSILKRLYCSCSVLLKVWYYTADVTNDGTDSGFK